MGNGSWIAQAGARGRLVAGILRDSGSPALPIIFGILVVAVLIANIAFFILSRRRAAAVVTSAPLQGAEATSASPQSGDGTLRLERRWTGLFGAAEIWPIAIDATTVGSLAPHETVDVAVAPGHHTLRLGQGRHLSREQPFDVAKDELVSFSCHGPRIGGVLVAALRKPELWISLTRE
jgi:hypothetical protein